MAGATWSVYIVECSDGSLYTGIALDVAQRVRKHNEGLGAKYTRSRRPVKLMYKEYGYTRGEALKRERQIRRLGRDDKEALIRASWGKS